MIDPEQIPDDVVEAAARQICGYERDQDMDWREYIGHARAAIAAALSAWAGGRGGRVAEVVGWYHTGHELIFPLTEKTDG